MRRRGQRPSADRNERRRFARAPVGRAAAGADLNIACVRACGHACLGQAVRVARAVGRSDGASHGFRILLSCIMDKLVKSLPFFEGSCVFVHKPYTTVRPPAPFARAERRRLATALRTPRDARLEPGTRSGSGPAGGACVPESAGLLAAPILPRGEAFYLCLQLVHCRRHGGGRHRRRAADGFHRCGTSSTCGRCRVWKRPPSAGV